MYLKGERKSVLEMMIGLLGHGVVGSGVRKIVDEAYTSETASLCIKKILVKQLSTNGDERETANMDDILNDKDISAVVECIGGTEPAHTYVKKALEAHKNVVTSNKKMLAIYAKELFETAEKNGVHLLYEASAAGGIPWIHELKRIRRIDDIVSFEGIMNGTTNYILSSMEKDGSDFKTVLKKAQELGYAERDPSDDIDGYDVRYKTALSALTAFDVFVKPEEIPCTGIRHIRKKDMEYAKKNGLKIKLLGRGKKEGKKVTLSVIPCFISNDNILAAVDQNFNAVSCVSATLGKAVFTGQGAGSLPTAHAVVQDLLDLENNRILKSHTLREAEVKSSEKGVFYIRTECSLNDIPYKKIDEDTVLTECVCFSEVIKAVKNDENALVIEVLK